MSDLGTACPFAIKARNAWGGTVLSVWPIGLFSRRRRFLQQVDEVGGRTFHVVYEPPDFRQEKVVEEKGEDTDNQPCRCRQQGFPYAACEYARVYIAFEDLNFLKGLDHSGYRSKKT